MPTADLYDLCKTSDFTWSVVSSSVPSASLAAVLAGFMITATAFLLNRQHLAPTHESLHDSHAIALFSAGVLVLGLDSYLFSGIAATSPPVDRTTGRVLTAAAHACSIAWTQGMPASAMLAVGATAMSAGLGSMLTQYLLVNGAPEKVLAHVDDADTLSTPAAREVTPKTLSDSVIGFFPVLLVGVAIATTSLMVWRYALRYVQLMADVFGVRSEMSAGALEVTWVAFIICIVVVLVRRACTIKSTTASAGALTPHIGWVTAAAFAIAIFALVGAVVAALASGVDRDRLTPSPVEWVDSSLAVSLCFLLVIQLFIALSTPGPGFPSLRRLMPQVGPAWRKHNS